MSSHWTGTGLRTFPSAHEHRLHSSQTYFRQLNCRRKALEFKPHSVEAYVIALSRQQHMGNYWLLKTEPECWSWDSQTANKGLSVWDGVRNHQAQKAMRNMEEGDLCFFYHTGKLKEVCGIVRVVKAFYPDPTDDTGKWGAVDVQEVLSMKNNVTLAQMKEDEEIADFLMFRQPRLSVVPVEEKVWTRICNMGEVDPPMADSSGSIEEEVGATNGSRKRAAEPKAAAGEKQDKRKVAGGRKKAADSGESEPLKSKVKPAAAAVKEAKSKAPPAKRVSSRKSKTDVDGSDVEEPVQPAKVAKRRVNQSKPAADDEEEEVPSAKATRNRRNQANSVSVEKKGETKPSKPSKRQPKKSRKEDET